MSQALLFRALFRSLHLPSRRMGLLLLGFLAAAAGMRAQGGPPMITDDPGTPGNGNWEINTAWTYVRTPGLSAHGLPLLDANYGVGDRLQINYQSAYEILRGADVDDGGLQDSQLALKWRFYDGGDQGWQASTYPRVTFADPDSDRAAEDGIADPHATLLVPAEVLRDFGVLSVDADFGPTLSRTAADRGWMGGVAVGREIRKGWELDAEVHATTGDRPRDAETILNFGTRIDFGAHTTLLLAAGRDLRNTLTPRASLLTYTGLQARF